MSWKTSAPAPSYLPVSTTNPQPALNISFNGVNPLDPSHPASEFPVRCILPISGQFGLAARLLYYSLLAFVLVARSHVWLSAGALASAMAYSSLASIYALILAGTYKYAPLDDQQIEDPYETGDIDMVALWCILSAGWFAVVPFLSWSRTLRRLRGRRAIFMYWTFLITVGGTCAGIKLRGGHPYKIYWATATAICTSKADHHQDVAELYLSSWLAWSSNNCTSQCGSLDPGLSLRTGTQMVPIIQTELSTITPPIIYAKETWGSLTGYASPIIFIQWIYAWWSGRRTPSEARDRICIKLCRRRSQHRKMRYILTVSIAMSVYAFACASLTLCPFLFLFNIIFNEMNMLYLPQDEPFSAVGQWSQCVIAIIVIIAAIINKYHDGWSLKIKTLSETVMKRPFNRRIERFSDPSDLELQPVVKGLPQPSSLVSCEPLVPRKTVSKWPIRPLRTAWLDARKEWRDFCHWIKNPIKVSRYNTAVRKVEETQPEHSSDMMGYVSSDVAANSPIELINLIHRKRTRSL